MNSLQIRLDALVQVIFNRYRIMFYEKIGSTAYPENAPPILSYDFNGQLII